MWALLIFGALAAYYFLIGGLLSSGGCCVANCGITNDPGTWPTGDAIWNLAHAIALAEGANIAGSNPDRLNNPGDISDQSWKYSSEYHSGSLVTKFPDKQTGWNALYSKLKSDFVDGTSTVYSPEMTWTEFAQKYAGNWQNWVANVTNKLGVSPLDQVGNYFSSSGISCG